MRKFCLFLTLFTFYNTVMFAQSPKSNPASIDEKFEILGKNPVADPNQEEAILLKLKTESEKLGYTQGILQSGDKLMKLYLDESRNRETVELGNQLKKIALNKKDTKGYITNLYRKNALALGYIGLDDASIKDFKTAIKSAENIQDKNKKLYLLSLCYQNITVYYNNKRFENKTYRDSIVYYLGKSIDMAKQIIDNNKTVSNDLKYDQIGFINMRLGIFYLEEVDKQGSLELAEKYLLEGLKIYENKKYHILSDNKIMLLNQVSWLYMEKKDYQRSIDFAKRAMVLEKQYSDPYHRVESFEFLANSYLEIGEKEKSKFYMNKYTFLKDSIAYIDKNNADTTMTKMVAEVDNGYKKDIQKRLILIGIFILIAVIATLILWRRKNKMMRSKYEQMIEKLKNGDLIIDNKLPLPHNTISYTTEKKLLMDLETFEKSDIYLKKDITISFLSNKFNTNTKYLSEIIKKNRSRNFSNYINDLRINYIVYKLYDDPRYREYKISYLSEQCGFASYQVFVLAFKKLNGVTPSYFIQNLKNENVLS